MFNRLFSKITGALASLSRRSAPSTHSFLCSPSKHEPLHREQHMAILKELRRNGSDRTWPRYSGDKEFFTAFNRIITKTSTNLRLPLPVVQNALFSMMWPRLEPLFAAKLKDSARIPKYHTGKLAEIIHENGRILRLVKTNIQSPGYPEYKGEWKFLGSQIAALPKRTGYETFQTMLRSAGPKGFADDPEEKGRFTFAVAWSMDGVGWFRLEGDEKYWRLYQACLENNEEEFTVVFLKGLCNLPQE